MKVSELKAVAETFLLENGDAEVKLLHEPSVFLDGYCATLFEEPTDIRKVQDWPLPGGSILFPNEGSEMTAFFVLMYGDTPI